MDKSTHIPGIKEATAKAITASEAVAHAALVMDRVTGKLYDPKAKFDEMMQKEEIVAVLKRLSIR